MIKEAYLYKKLPEKKVQCQNCSHYCLILPGKRGICGVNKNLYQKIFRDQTPIKNSKKVTVISSGDLSHCLKEEGPYGFHPDGPKFDRELIESLRKKDIEKILKLDELYPKAGECGLRSFCFLLGILEASKINWQPEILSYEGPFGADYLVTNFKIK